MRTTTYIVNHPASYYVRHEIRDMGGDWNAEQKVWEMPDALSHERAMDACAKFLYDYPEMVQIKESCSECGKFAFCIGGACKPCAEGIEKEFNEKAKDDQYVLDGVHSYAPNVEDVDREPMMAMEPYPGAEEEATEYGKPVTGFITTGCLNCRKSCIVHVSKRTDKGVICEKCMEKLAWLQIESAMPVQV